VDQPFQLNLPENAVENGENKAGEGCYISATIHNRRYYGVLIDQASLKAASMLHFQDKAAGLELNRKIEYLKAQKLLEQTQSPSEVDGGDDRKRPAESDNQDDSNKRIKLKTDPGTTNKESSPDDALAISRLSGRPVQKFRYVDAVDQSNGSQISSPGYRILVATFADSTVAADDDTAKARLIEAACRAGGGFVGPTYFYQFEVCATNT